MALASRGEASSRATIYRLLGRLYAVGWLLPYHIATVKGAGTPEAGVQHASVRALPGYYSAICAGCGRIHFIKGERIAAHIALLLAEVGFVMQEHRLELYGSCGECGASHSSATATNEG